jgi:hypothetical protein
VSVGAIIAIVVVVVIVIAALAIYMTRRSAERRSLGPEYNRLVDEVGTRKANAEYDKRRRRVDGLGIKPLSDERRSLYGTQWVAAQEMFIDNPNESVRSAAALVTAVAADRGYEVADSDQLLTDLSVNYGPQLEGYRGALALTDGTGTATEKLRQALLDYRSIFRELAGLGADGDETTATTATADTTGAGTAGAVTPATTDAAVPAQVDETAPEATEGTGHRVFWRRESPEASGVSGSQN